MQLQLEALETDAVDEPTPARPRGPRNWVGMVLLAVVVLAACSALGFFYVKGSGGTAAANGGGRVIEHTIQRADFVSVVTETGDLESASNEEVRCEVKSVAGGAGTTILKIIEEGTYVKGPREIEPQGNETPEQLAEAHHVTVEALRAANGGGDLAALIDAKKAIKIPGRVLVQFDDAALQQNLTQQEIQVALDQAAAIEAQSELEKSEQTLKEYKDGLFVVDKETFESELLQAKSHLKSATDSMEHSQRMFRKGYVSRLQYEAQREAVEMAQKTVQVAQKKLEVHVGFTKDRMIKEYEAEVKKRKAYLTAAEKTLTLSEQRRDDILEQIAHCQVEAPGDGVVVYANDTHKQIVIEEGAQIRQRQVVIRLPDPQRMQVQTRINNSKLNKVAVGCRAEIILDVNPDLPVYGVLDKINKYPMSRRWHGEPITYGAYVKVVDPPPQLRPGQRAKIKIFAQPRKNVLQTPIQSVHASKKKHYCLVKNSRGKWERRQVTIGPSNDSYAVVESGLKEGDVVAVNPDLIWKDGVGEDPQDTKQEKQTAMNSR